MLLLLRLTSLVLVATGVETGSLRVKQFACQLLNRCHRPAGQDAIPPAVYVSGPREQTGGWQQQDLQDRRKFSIGYWSTRLETSPVWWEKAPGMQSPVEVARMVAAEDLDFVVFNSVRAEREIQRVERALPGYTGYYLPSMLPDAQQSQRLYPSNLGILSKDRLGEMIKYEWHLHDHMLSCRLNPGGSASPLQILIVEAQPETWRTQIEASFKKFVECLDRLEPGVPVIVLGQFPYEYEPLIFHAVEEAIRYYAFLWAHRLDSPLSIRLLERAILAPREPHFYSELEAAWGGLVRAGPARECGLDRTSVFASREVQVLGCKSWREPAPCSSPITITTVALPKE